MTRFQSVALGVPLWILLAAIPAGSAPPGKAGAIMPKSGQKVAAHDKVDAASVAALRRMSTYLTSLNTAGITSTGSIDIVSDDGQRIQLDGVTTYKVRRPSGFVIEYNSDIKKRRFVYDGKTFTVYAPTTGQYATVAAPATNREVLDTIYNKYGISLPLEDLLLWADPKSDRAAA